MTKEQQIEFDRTKKEIYEQRNGGPFSFEKQFDRIKDLRQRGTKVGLILGRTVSEGPNRSGRILPVNEEQAWAYLDLQAEYGDNPHFVMDITDISAWEKFDDNMFNFIIFDWTVFDYAMSSAAEKGLQADVFVHLTRVLEPKGTLSFNAVTQWDMNLASANDLVLDPDKAHIFPVTSDTNFGVKKKLQDEINTYNALIKKIEILNSKPENQLDFEEVALKEEFARRNYLSPEIISKLNDHTRNLNETLTAQREKDGITVVEHTKNQLIKFGYEDVRFETTRPWCNYDAKGFFIATKRSN